MLSIILITTITKREVIKLNLTWAKLTGTHVGAADKKTSKYEDLDK